VSTAVRGWLVDGLALQMKSMSPELARQLASELTTQINAHVFEPAQIRAEERAGGSAAFPREMWNELTVGVPWEAYVHAHGAGGTEVAAHSTQAICSAPAHFDSMLLQQSAHSGLWGGSLLVALGKILEDVQKELIVIAPYWRMDGVQSLLATASRATFAGVMVTILTQSKFRMHPDDSLGLNYFLRAMRSAGAEVRVLMPRTQEGFVPHVHAKLLVSDGMRAYVGSANFTRSGLDHGIEAGVLTEGEAAQAFAMWARALIAECEHWPQ
jgi:phosphatidylserine/phosphatidylglycerophosphate/cardiolipin synthase-like enzyme